MGECNYGRTKHNSTYFYNNYNRCLNVVKDYKKLYSSKMMIKTVEILYQLRNSAVASMNLRVPRNIQLFSLLNVQIDKNCSHVTVFKTKMFLFKVM